MPDPFDEEFTGQNPIVAAASRIRARRDIEKIIEQTPAGAGRFDDAESAFRAFGEALAAGSKRLNSILGERNGVKFVRVDKPARVTLRFNDMRVRLDLDDMHQLVRVKGLDLDGEYQFDPDSPVPSLINLSKVSTEAGYGERITPSFLLQSIARDAELPRPAHLERPGPLQF